jgi:N-methylhydantoinase A
MNVGVDIGGTFTDLVMSVDGRLNIHKLFTTPDNPAEAMLASLGILSPHGSTDVERIAHGTTIATNVILERKGARVAFITTQGFRDMLFIGRQNRPDLYALHPQLPPPLVPRSLCYEVPERVDHRGTILTPLDMDALDLVLDDIMAHEVEAVAICFLFSYVNPIHERAVRERLVARGLFQAWQVVLSSEVLPEFREYERASTVVLDAYVRPVVGRYFEYLEDQLPETCALRVMKSDGGLISVARARNQAIHTALSGPAAGVIGAFHIARLAGYDRIITLDIGGTSTDVALCPGNLVRRPESQIGDLPLRIRLLDIETIGAGGGSIARVDAGGALRVGPESAGAMPGPVIYGRGGERITVSDAHALLNRLDADHFLGGRMTLQIAAAERAMADLARQAQLSPEALALGIIEVANVNIDRALRRVSIGRGHDPREFTLIAFGGAGPLHACEIAERLMIPRVLVPRYPGVLCAFGLLAADVVLDYSRAIMQPLTSEVPARLTANLNELITLAHRDLQREGIGVENRVCHAQLDMRYRGQAYELTIPLSLDEELGHLKLGARFHETHAQTYGHGLPDRIIEIVNLRVLATGVVEKPLLEPETLTLSDGAEALLGHKEAIFRHGTGLIALYDREHLAPGAQFDGPALLFQLDSTVYVPPGWSARIDGYRNVILEYSS